MRLPAPFAAALLLLTSATALAAEPPCSTVCARYPLCVDVCSVNGEDTNCGDAGYRCVQTLGVDTEATTSVRSTEDATQVCREGHPDGEQPQTAEG
ncbi:hypothetical protein COCOR_03137 [Corallococcus coralloides DSM 2259]|uniref:Lipoprotein n=1 Tax=Corallococcus coralloides (strain ATCC 25202 / DSM 2259 / NBRC 100086 / M2) TaxID=1144275 RepID=H8MF33_CORCM|nr:hypothetical protein [Corallococcus coralloides]AFE05029.1 hypothetical protein COCOR_03137 [Corallococcus coralloides DSM 2259]